MDLKIETASKKRFSGPPYRPRKKKIVATITQKKYWRFPLDPSYPISFNAEQEHLGATNSDQCCQLSGQRVLVLGERPANSRDRFTTIIVRLGIEPSRA